ncbi:MAG: DUF1552 domain-containing protein [Myxococcales bacterium]|nr:DUF1552 domain-containing protein [Myxococcales bacterium]MDD9965001.1 DUF1552 domain-containing protein [Myxococcales bacterium]
MRHTYRIRRRNFLTGAAATGFAYWLQRFEALAQGAEPAKRLLIMHHPVGTVKRNWACTGTETEWQLSRILAPFEPVKSHMVVLDGMDIVAPGPGGGHEKGTVVVMTGVPTRELYPGNGGDDPKAAGPSIDQRLLGITPALQGTPIASLQVSCDDRVDVREISTRRLSYTGPAAPMEPYLTPKETYERVFGSLMMGGSQNAAALANARMLRKSVLDFGLSDLRKLRTLAPSSEHERLDAHEEAVRALETELDQSAQGSGSCGLSETPQELDPFLDTRANRIGNGVYSTVDADKRDDEIHATIGRLHFSVIKAAFVCDLTRVATFQWSPGTNHVSFMGMYPGEPTSIKMHHPLSHEFNNRQVPEFLTNVDTWYSERTSEMLQSLLDTEDAGGGNLLDNTVVPYVTEVARADHTFYDAPFVVFGGAGVGIQGNRLKQYRSRRPVNDMWLAVGQGLGAQGFTSLGTRSMETGPLDILI